MSDDDELQRLWAAERRRLLGLATAMLRDSVAAEDLVQEVFVRFSARQSSPAPTERLRNPAAWLSVATANLCLDHLKSAQHRHESTGVDELVGDLPSVGVAVPEDPLDRITLDDQIRRAMLIVLDRLSPEERASFVLHDVFGLPYDEIARTTGASVDNSRQLASRARRKLAATDWRTTSVEEPIEGESSGSVTDRFLAACRGGSLTALVDVLRPEVWGVAFTTAGQRLQENRGSAAVAGNLLTFLAPPTLLVEIDDVILGFRGLRWLARIELDRAGDRVRSIHATVDPAVWGSDLTSGASRPTAD